MLRAALQGRSRSTASALRALAHTQPPGAAAGSEDGERGYGEPASEPPAVPWVRSVISGGASLAQPRLASARSPSLPVELLRSPVYNKGMAFSEAERSNLFLRGAADSLGAGDDKDLPADAPAPLRYACTPQACCRRS